MHMKDLNDDDSIMKIANFLKEKAGGPLDVKEW